MKTYKLWSIIFADSFLLTITLFSFLHHSNLTYGLSQAKGQLHIVFNTREVGDVLKDKSVPDSIKSKLKLIAEIKRFAIDSLGIKPNENYTTFYNQQGKPQMWVVTAAEPYKMKAYEWEFPFLGSFPYKGYFEKEKAEKEFTRFKNMGYDTDLGTVSGWSTLGWLRDPVLSGMLKKSEGQLANLIIHEMTHGTLFVKDSADFNENLASFIGHQGALRFLRYKYGNDSPQLKRYEEEDEDEKKFVKYVLSGAMKLEAFYEEAKGDTVKLKEGKKLILQTLSEGVHFLQLKNQSRYQNIANEMTVSGNAFFMGYYRYDERQDQFERELNGKFQGNLRKYLQNLQILYPSL